MTSSLPSIARRLAWTLLAAALASSLAVAAAVWLAVRHEVDELLDDTLQGAAEAMRPHLAHEPGNLHAGIGAPERASDRYAWQVVEYGADAMPKVLQRSSRAPVAPLSAAPCAGFADRAGLRVAGRDDCVEPTLFGVNVAAGKGLVAGHHAGDLVGQCGAGGAGEGGAEQCASQGWILHQCILPVVVVGSDVAVFGALRQA